MRFNNCDCPHCDPQLTLIISGIFAVIGFIIGCLLCGVFTLILWCLGIFFSLPKSLPPDVELGTVFLPTIAAGAIAFFASTIVGLSKHKEYEDKEEREAPIRKRKALHDSFLKRLCDKSIAVNQRCEQWNAVKSGSFSRAGYGHDADYVYHGLFDWTEGLEKKGEELFVELMDDKSIPLTTRYGYWEKVKYRDFSVRQVPLIEWSDTLEGLGKRLQDERWGNLINSLGDDSISAKIRFHDCCRGLVELKQSYPAIEEWLKKNKSFDYRFESGESKEMLHARITEWVAQLQAEFRDIPYESRNHYEKLDTESSRLCTLAKEEEREEERRVTVALINQRQSYHYQWCNCSKCDCTRTGLDCRYCQCTKYQDDLKREREWERWREKEWEKEQERMNNESSDD